MKIIEFLPEEFSDEDWDRYFEHREQILKEQNPYDPLPSREPHKAYLFNPEPYFDLSWWIAVDEESNRIVGRGALWWDNEKSGNYEERQYDARTDFILLPEYRTDENHAMFLLEVARKAKAHGKRELLFMSQSEHQFDFLNSLGGTMILRRTTNRMKMDTVDWSMIQSWMDEGPIRAKQVSLETFVDVPEDDLEQFTDLYTDTWNGAPSDEETSRTVFTPEQRRESEKNYREQGKIWTTMITRESNGDISGLTETWYHPESGHVIEQGLTGVREKYRGRGLGKWLKAAMLLHIRNEYPESKVVETKNAVVNAPMLSINDRMGFRVHRQEMFRDYIIEDIISKLSDY